MRNRKFIHPLLYLGHAEGGSRIYLRNTEGELRIHSKGNTSLSQGHQTTLKVTNPATCMILGDRNAICCALVLLFLKY